MNRMLMSTLPICEPPTFVSLDFETANRSPRSAVALATCLVAGGEVKQRMLTLFRPPTRSFPFAKLHGIGRTEVENAPSFASAWSNVEAVLTQGCFFAAHNASFDRGVLTACCEYAGIPCPRRPFLCTVALAREVWSLFPTKLPDVCQFLEIELDHHDAASDANACAAIVLAAWSTPQGRKRIRTLVRG